MHLPPTIRIKKCLWLDFTNTHHSRKYFDRWQIAVDLKNVMQRYFSKQKLCGWLLARWYWSTKFVNLLSYLYPSWSLSVAYYNCPWRVTIFPWISVCFSIPLSLYYLGITSFDYFCHQKEYTKRNNVNSSVPEAILQVIYILQH